MWYLVRHPETIANFEHRYLGWQQSPLSERGKEQKTRLVDFLSQLDDDINCVLSSDSLRCTCVAETVAENRKLPLVISSNLRELDFGQWEGLTFSEVSQKYPLNQQKWLDAPYHTVPLGGEGLAQVVERSHQFLSKYIKQSIIVVIHGGIIASVLTEWSQGTIWNLLPESGVCIALDLKHRRHQKIFPQ